jgi:hypothetical protein
VQGAHLSTNRKKTEQERKQRIPSPFFLLFSNFRENGIPNADSLNKGKVSLDYRTNSNARLGVGRAFFFALTGKEKVAQQEMRKIKHEDLSWQYPWAKHVCPF